MTTRTNQTNVQQILPQTIDFDIILTFIDVANQIVTDNLSDQDLSDALLEKIELFLSAHLISTTVARQTQNRSVGDASETYAKLGEGLKSTTYGLIVLQLDTSKVLENMGKSACIIEAIPSFDDSLVL